MLEVSRVGIAESDDEIELSLELSIGGSYGKLEKVKQEENPGKENDKGLEVIVPRSGFSSFPETAILEDQLDTENVSGSECLFESKRKREIKGLRRQEARRKREEKIRKSGGNSKGNGTPFVGVANANDLLGLEAQKLQGRVRDREMRENDGLLDEIEKCVENGNGKNGFGYPLHINVGKEENGIIKGRNCFRAMGCGIFRAKVKHDSSGCECDSKEQNSGKSGSGIKKVMSNESLERSSSAISEYRSSIMQSHCGSNRETGSHSSCFLANEQQFAVSATNGKMARSESNASSDKNGLGHISREAAEKSSRYGTVEVTTNVKAAAPTSEPKEPSTLRPTNGTEGNSMASLPQMPCVSATGNGPNGKTITGFLYRYTKTEVSIVCVCHGSSFSPAEFVEHAGGTDVTNPLRYITMIPSSFE